ncbi:MAG: formimidoylglutamase [Chitinophagaceae bacterium]
MQFSFETISCFLEPINTFEISNDEGYKDTQLGKNMVIYEGEYPEVADADLIIVGCGEMRGNGIGRFSNAGINAVRHEFYSLYHWHKTITVADIGNIQCGATITDTYAALRAVISELLPLNKKVLIIGGSHDVTLAQYQAYVHAEKIIEATCIDAKIDIDMSSVIAADNFLMEMLTGVPNYVKHYNHIGFQSYFVHPHMLETIDKLRFDCFRVGKVKELLDEMEPPIRNSHLLSVDIAAIQNAHAPANILTPNGFTGEEICTLMQYAGMSNQLSTAGIYGFLPQYDKHNLTAKQISHMLWYFMDGMYKGKQEALLTETANFKTYELAFAELVATFYQSKKTGRWWMQMPDGNMMACSKLDYIIASNNEIPERWMRSMERS